MKSQVFRRVLTSSVMSIAIMAAGVVNAEFETVNGVKWSYVIVGGEAHLESCWKDDDFIYHWWSEDGSWGWSRACPIPVSTTGAITVPSFLGGCPVTVVSGIGGCDITEVTIPGTVREIADYCFEGCRGLTKAVIPDSVSVVGEQAFADCESLVDLTLPRSGVRIGSGAFAGCRRLADASGFFCLGDRLCVYAGSGGRVVIPDGITWIDAEVFYGNASITSVVIPDSVGVIAHLAFAGCENLVSVSLGANLKWLGYGAFSDCGKLDSLVLPSSLVSINGCAFEGCSSLTAVHIPDSVRDIGGFAFSRCTKLSLVSGGNGLDRVAYGAIDETAFLSSAKASGREFLMLGSVLLAYLGPGGSVTISDGVRCIAGDAFNYGGVEKVFDSVSIPDSVVVCDDWAYNWTSRPFSVVGGRNIIRGEYYSGDVVTNGPVTCFNQLAVGSALSGDAVSLTVPEGVRGVARYAFCGLEGLRQVSLPASLEYVDAGAFDCTGTCAVVFGNPHVKVYASAFESWQGRYSFDVRVPSGYRLAYWEDAAYGVRYERLEDFYMEYPNGNWFGPGEGNSEFVFSPVYERLMLSGVPDSDSGVRFDVAAKYAGYLVDDDRFAGIVTVKAAKTNARNGSTKITAVVQPAGDTKKYNYKGVYQNGSCTLVCRGRPDMTVRFGNGVCGGEIGTMGFYAVLPDAAPEWLVFHVDGRIVYDGGKVYEEFLPDGIGFRGGQRWSFPKADVIKLVKDKVTKIPVLQVKSNGNSAALKLTYNAKDGTFKGTFKVYYLTDKGKLKSQTVKVSGVMVNGVGYGYTTNRFIGSVPVRLADK